MAQIKSKNTWLSDSLWLALGIGFFYFLFLGSRALNVPDEARYSEIPREMVATGHYLIPHLDYIIYFEKPDLFYWLQCLSIKLFGLSEWAMRFWVCSFGIFTCIAAYLAARKLFDRTTGIYSALVLASSLLFYLMSHYITLDMPVSFFLTLCLLCFLIGINETGNKRRNYIYLAAIMAGLAVLTKGLIGIVFPCMIIGLWILLLNQWKLLAKLYIPSALLVFFIVAVPWHVLMAKTQANWAYFYFITQQFTRYSTDDAGRYQPVWFFIPFLIVGLFPWIIFLPQALKNIWPKWRQRKRSSNELFLLIWAVTIFTFFSLSDSKLIPYIVPVFPALAILVGRYLAKIDQGKIKARFDKHFLILIIITLIIALGFFIVPLTTVLPNPYIAYFHVTLVNIALIATVLIANKCYRRLGLRKACISLLFGMAIILPMINLSIAHIDDRTIKPLALKIRPILKPDDIVLNFHHYFQDLPFYLRRRIVIVDWTNELTFGMQHQNVSGWVWTIPEMINRWSTSASLYGLCNTMDSLECRQQHQRIFAFMDTDTYHAFQKSHPGLKMYVIAHTNRNVVLCNEKVKL